MNPERDIAVTVPTAWHRRSDPEHGIVLAARARRVPPSGYAPDVVVRCTVVGEDLRDWRDAAMRSMATRLADFALEDEDEFGLGDHVVAYRRFAHRLGTADVISDQWAWLVDGIGVTLTCSVAREDYATYCDLFEAIAETVDVLPRVA